MANFTDVKEIQIKQVKPHKTRIMEKRNFRVKVMKYAHMLYTRTNHTWRTCLLKAWELYRLAKRMRDGIVKFAYQKVDGSIRYAWGTLHSLPAGITSGKSEKEPSYKTFAYYDTQKQSMRCFRVENLIAVY